MVFNMVEGCFVENRGIIVVRFCGHRNVLFMGRDCDYCAFYMVVYAFHIYGLCSPGALYVPFKAYLGRFQAIYG